MDLYEQLPSSDIIYQPEYKFLLDAATSHGITCLDFLSQSPANLMKVINRSINEIVKFQETLRTEFDKAITEIKIQKKVDIELEDRPMCFTSGDSEIDRLLGGGIYTKGITEIFGESSTGKSQLLLQLALSVQLPEEMAGLRGQSVYITTEGDLPTKRLDGIIQNSSLFKDEDGNPLVSQRRIFTVTCNDWANQEHVTTVQLPILLERHPSIRLVVIDSISHHLRVELQSKTFQESRDNRHIIDWMAEHLLGLAQKHNVAIVVANQVSDKLLQEKPVQQDFKDYDYQLGWFIGWKNSTIYYRHQFNEQERTNEDLLSDDEDYSLIVEQVAKKVQQKNNGNGESAPVASTSNQHQPQQQIHRIHQQQQQQQQNQNQNQNQNKTPGLNFISKRKRALDTKVPGLGLTWANHLMTRIKLEKWYQASPSIRSGNFDYDDTTDPTKFWQVRRNLKLIFSTYAPKGEMRYNITSEGVVSVK